MKNVMDVFFSPHGPIEQKKTTNAKAKAEVSVFDICAFRDDRKISLVNRNLY